MHLLRTMTPGIRHIGMVLLPGLIAATSAATPAVNWVLPDERIVAGEPFEVRCRSEWHAGDAAPHVLPPAPPSVEWGKLDLRRAESGFVDGAAFVDQVFELTASSPGSYELPAIEISYRATADGEPMTTSAPEASFEAVERQSPYAIPLVAASVAAVVAVIVVALRLTSKKSRAEPAPAASGPDVRALMKRARVARIEADFYGCYQALAKAADAAGGDEALVRELTARAEAAGFAGDRPDETLLDSDFRSVDHLIDHAERNTDV